MGIALDGYAPSREEFLEEVWPTVCREELAPSRWRSRLGEAVQRVRRRPMETTYLTGYRKAIAVVKLVSCPCQKDRLTYPPKTYQGHCVGRTYSTDRTVASMENDSGAKTVFTPANSSRFMDTVRAEYRHDEREGRAHYLQRLLVVCSDPENGCNRAHDCCDHWTKAVRFAEKDPSQYLDFTAYREAIQTLLADYASTDPLSQFLEGVREREHLRSVFYLSGR